MAKREQSAAFFNCMSPAHLQPGMIVSSWNDDLKSEWVVIAAATRVKDRWCEITMRCGNRTVTSHIAPDDTVLRKVKRADIAPEREY